MIAAAWEGKGPGPWGWGAAKLPAAKLHPQRPGRLLPRGGAEHPSVPGGLGRLRASVSRRKGALWLILVKSNAAGLERITPSERVSKGLAVNGGDC